MNICLEGIDGCGKSTQTRMLSKYYNNAPIIKHPGYTEYGLKIRNIILGDVQPHEDMVNRLLFYADHIENVAFIKTTPHVTSDIIIWDRHPKYSNFAYGAAMGTDKMSLLSIYDLLDDNMAKMDYTFIIDVTAEVAKKRMNKRNDDLTVIEKRGLNYFQKVRENYLDLYDIYKEIFLINGMQSEIDIHREILTMLGEIS